jgi:polar amino acid transport system permease protein
LIQTSKKSGSSEAAWWAVLGTALLLIAGLLLARDDSGEHHFRTIFTRILDGRTYVERVDDTGVARLEPTQSLWHSGVAVTARVVLTAMALSLLLGIIFGAAQCQAIAWIRFLGTFYVEIVRGVPIYVMLLFVYFGVNALLRDRAPEGMLMSPFIAAVLALGVSYGAYMAEVVRAGILAIPHEEIEAARLEASPVQVLRFVVLPQAMRIILPAIANECIALLKDSALVGAITLVDLTRRADIYARSTFQYFQAFAALALVYLVLTLLLSRVQRWLEFKYGDARAHKY